MMKVPHLGEIEFDEEMDEYVSTPISVGVLGGKVCRIMLEGYGDDESQEDFHAAVGNFLAASHMALHAAEDHVYRYYLDIKRCMEGELDEDFPDIASAAEVWRHVHFGAEPVVSRRYGGDQSVYVSIECNCDWEVEHGLQIVFKQGREVCKVGPFDGHLTNSDAFADPSLEGVVYRSFA
jgi:hypothetical protein